MMNDLLSAGLLRHVDARVSGTVALPTCKTRSRMPVPINTPDNLGNLDTIDTLRVSACELFVLEGV